MCKYFVKFVNILRSTGGGSAFDIYLADIYTLSSMRIFKTDSLTIKELVLSIALAPIVFFAVEIEKFWKRRIL